MRRAVVRTPLADAARVAAAVTPDNTTELSTRVEDGAVVTTIDRDTTGGLRSTLDDYLVNLGVADATGTHATDHLADTLRAATDDPEHGTDSQTTDDTDTPTDTP